MKSCTWNENKSQISLSAKDILGISLRLWPAQLVFHSLVRGSRKLHCKSQTGNLRGFVAGCSLLCFCSAAAAWKQQPAQLVSCWGACLPSPKIYLQNKHWSGFEPQASVSWLLFEWMSSKHFACMTYLIFTTTLWSRYDYNSCFILVRKLEHREVSQLAQGQEVSKRHSCWSVRLWYLGWFSWRVDVKNRHILPTQLISWTRGHPTCSLSLTPHNQCLRNFSGSTSEMYVKPITISQLRC